MCLAIDPSCSCGVEISNAVDLISFGTHHAHRITHESIILISSVFHDDMFSLRVGGGVHDKLHISSADWWDILLTLA